MNNTWLATAANQIDRAAERWLRRLLKDLSSDERVPVERPMEPQEHDVPVLRREVLMPGESLD